MMNCTCVSFEVMTAVIDLAPWYIDGGVYLNKRVVDLHVTRDEWCDEISRCESLELTNEAFIVAEGRVVGCLSITSSVAKEALQRASQIVVIREVQRASVKLRLQHVDVLLVYIMSPAKDRWVFKAMEASLHFGGVDGEEGDPANQLDVSVADLPDCQRRRHADQVRTGF